MSESFDPRSDPTRGLHALILREVSDAVIAIDKDNLITYLNPSAEYQYGTTAADAIGHPLDQLYRDEWIAPDDEARAATALATEGFWRGEHLHVLRDGRVLRVESSMRLLGDMSGQPAGLLTVIRDVTAARQVQDAIRQREERFRRALSIETVGVLFFTLDGRITDANTAFVRMCGYSVDELRQVHWKRLTAPDFLELTTQNAHNLLVAGETPAYEKRMIRKDGSAWWGLFSPRRIGAPSPAAECVEFIVDITHSKRAEVALRESDERQRMALDAADMGTWHHDILTNRVTLDARGQRHYGLAEGDVDIMAIASRIHPADWPEVERAIAAAIDPRVRAPVQAEYRVTQPDGTTRWLSISGRVQFTDVNGEERAVAGIGTTRDITDQKRAEEALRDADRRKDEFLAILAHELRNPLAPIRTAVGILRTPGVPEPIHNKSREIIERQVAHMTRLVDDLLDVSRLSRGKMRLQCVPVTLDQILDAAIETARPVIEEHRHRLEQQRPAHPIYVNGDLARLSQVFANLLNNAAKYTPAGGTITIDVADHDETIDVRVSDTGQGIVPDRLDTIFTLFAQGSGAASPTVGGLGIGLALARKLVELHNGTLTAFSQGPDRGASFTVTLPALPRSTVIDQPRRVAEAPRHLGRRVLVVDDSVDAAETTATLLEAAGCVARAAYSGDQALSEVPQFHPEIVLLDIGMPGLNGLEACHRMRSLPGGDAMFIVALTGWGQEDDRRKTREAGFDAHLVKPVSPESLLSLVEHAPDGGHAAKAGY